MPDEFKNPLIDASNEAFIQSLVGAPRRSPGDMTLFSGPEASVRLFGLLYLGFMLRSSVCCASAIWLRYCH
jgi:hypothetical protein